MTPTEKLDKDFNDEARDDGPIEGQLLESKPLDLPQLAPKPGFKTSQGQLTAVFALVALVLSLLGFKYSSDDVANAYAMVQNIVQVIGPIITLVPVLIAYINSRGKIQSNSLWASASLSTGVGKDGLAVGSPALTSATTTLAQPASFAGIGGLLGGKNWKDPKRYLNIAKIGGTLVPGLGSAADAISGDSEQEAFNEEVRRGMEQLGQNDLALNDKLDKILASIKQGG